MTALPALMSRLHSPAPRRPAIELRRRFRSVMLLILAGLSGFFPAHLLALKAGGTSVTGLVVDQAVNHPLQFVTVTLKKNAGDSPVETTVTDSRGRFTLENIAPGEYK